MHLRCRDSLQADFVAADGGMSIAATGIESASMFMDLAEAR
jgi:hypothetical protein